MNSKEWEYKGRGEEVKEGGGGREGGGEPLV